MSRIPATVARRAALVGALLATLAACSGSGRTQDASLAAANPATRAQPRPALVPLPPALTCGSERDPCILEEVRVVVSRAAETGTTTAPAW